MVLCLWELLELFEDYCWTVTSEISCSIFPLLDVSLFFFFKKTVIYSLMSFILTMTPQGFYTRIKPWKIIRKELQKMLSMKCFKRSAEALCEKKNMLFQKRTCTLFDKLSQNLTIMFILHSCTTTMTPQGFYSKSLLHAMHFAWEKFLWGKRRITEIYLIRFLDISWKYSSFY